MYGNNLGSNLSLGKVLSGISKTLNIVNQAIPIYNQLKPIVSNASNILSVFKEMNKTDNQSDTLINEPNIKKIEEKRTVEEKKETLTSNTLTFFQ